MHIVFIRLIILNGYINKTRGKIHEIHDMSNSDADRKAEDRRRITLYTVRFFLGFGSQLPSPRLPGSVPPRGVMVTAAAEAWVVTVEAEQ